MGEAKEEITYFLDKKSVMVEEGRPWMCFMNSSIWFITWTENIKYNTAITSELLYFVDKNHNSLSIAWDRLEKEDIGDKVSNLNTIAIKVFSSILKWKEESYSRL